MKFSAFMVNECEDLVIDSVNIEINTAWRLQVLRQQITWAKFRLILELKLTVTMLISMSTLSIYYIDARLV